MSLIQKRSRSNRQNLHWSIAPLEQRLLLAGDAGVAVAEAIPAEVAAPAPPHSLTTTHQSASVDPDQAVATAVHLVFVDAAVEDLDTLIDAIESPFEIVLLSPDSSGVAQITDAMANHASVASIHLIGHGRAGAIMLGNEMIDEATLLSHAAELHRWSESLTKEADILLYGCETGAQQEGANFIKRLARLTGADVAASSDTTGHRSKGGNWELERSVGMIDSPLPFANEFRNTYDAILPVTIRAAGTTNEEQMLLQIDGVTVATYDNVGGNASNDTFVNYTYNEDGINPNQVRIVFTNDLYDPANGIDRNLRVDSINIDGVTYQTEDPSVFSTGVWLPEDGIEPGYRTSEYLASNGYFQYAGESNNEGSLIEIRAMGQEGTEQFDLQIDGQTVASYDATTSFDFYQFRSGTTVTADQIRVVFKNDFYDPANGIDANLTVDYISIDSSRFETEAPTVYSTGVWKEADGIAPGFREDETLATNGYFQYAEQSTTNPGVIALDTSVIQVNEAAGSVTIQVNRTTGSDGIVSVDYQTLGNTAEDGIDFQGQSGTLTFADGQTTASVVVPIIADTLTEGNESFSFAIDNVQGGATILAPRTATITIRDDQLPNYPSFVGATGLELNGDASINGSALRLTGAQELVAGTAFYQSPLPLGADTSFVTSFQFQLTGGNATAGADGFTFALQNAANGVNTVGNEGGGLGIDGVSNSVAIKFDTYQNPGDPNDNHVGIVVNGNVGAALNNRSAAFDLNSGNVLTAWIEYNGFTNEMDVFLSDDVTQPDTPMVSAVIDLPSLIGSQAYVGFTAATGDLTNVHEIMNWQFTTDVPEPNDPPPTGNTLVTQTVLSGLVKPTSLDWTPDGRNLYVSQQDGIVRVARDGVLLATPTLDFTAHVNGTSDRGLLDIAVHPDLETNPYLYLLYTYDPPEVYQHLNDELARPDGIGNRAARMTRVTLDAATDYTTIIADSEVVLLGTNSVWDNFNAFVNSTTDFDEPPAGILPDGSNLRDFIATDSQSHTIGSIEFGTDGALYVSIGDGTSYNRVDPRTVRVQDIDNLSGKILRVDPLTGAGLADNPFFNGDPDANRSKVYQYGMRNPFRIALDSQTNQLYVGDVGWTSWEEINSAEPGANFGWPYYEGGSGVSNRTNSYQDLPEAQAFYASGEPVVASLFALNHAATGINAIVLGDVYHGDAYPEEYEGDLFFNDLGQGIVRNINFDASGAITSVDTFTTGANVVVQIATGLDGNLYFVDLDDGIIGRWVFV